jgi:hypothetical protein
VLGEIGFPLVGKSFADMSESPVTRTLWIIFSPRIRLACFHCLAGFFSEGVRVTKAQCVNPRGEQSWIKLLLLIAPRTIRNRHIFIWNIKNNEYLTRMKTASCYYWIANSWYSQNGANSVHLVAPDQAENAKVVSNGSATGQVTPPLTVVKE